MNDAAQVLERFTAACREALLQSPGPEGRMRVRDLLRGILTDDIFLRAYCINREPGLHRLHEDPQLGFEVLVHINDKPRVSPPHDHGESWAVYGQATAHTDVTEWRRLDDGGDRARAHLTPIRTYRLNPGEAGIYQDGMIHSIDYPEKSCFVRVTGTNLDRIPRVMFDLTTGAVKQMTPQRAT